MYAKLKKYSISFDKSAHGLAADKTDNREAKLEVFVYYTNFVVTVINKTRGKIQEMLELVKRLRKYLKLLKRLKNYMIVHCYCLSSRILTNLRGKVSQLY
jgi:cytochrome oxidase Cu insertion factor (SCO1/SenC/PrrC family)